MPLPPRFLSLPFAVVLGLLLFTAPAQAHQDAAKPFATLLLDSIVFLPLALHQPNVQPTPAAAIANSDFEAGPGDAWSESSTVIGNKPGAVVKELHDTSIIAPRSGRYVAWFGGIHDDTSIISQTITLPAGTPRLEYAYRAYSEEPACGVDGGEIALVSGETVNVLEPIELCLAQEREQWTVKQIDLTPYAGQAWTLRIRVATNDSLYSHLFVDDINLFAP